VTSMLQDVRRQPDHNNGRSCSEHSRLFVRGSEVELVHDRPPPGCAFDTHHTQPINKSPNRRLHFCIADQRVLFLHDMTVTQ